MGRVSVATWTVCAFLVLFLVVEAEFSQFVVHLVGPFLLAWLSCSVGSLALPLWIAAMAIFRVSLQEHPKEKEAGEDERDDAEEEAHGQQSREAADLAHEPLEPDQGIFETVDLHDPTPAQLDPVKITSFSDARWHLDTSLSRDGLDWRSVFWISLLLTPFQILPYYMYMLGLKYTSAAAALTIFNSSCVFVYIGSVFLLNETVNVWKIMAVILGLAGVVLVAFFGAHGNNTAHNHQRDDFLTSRNSTNPTNPDQDDEALFWTHLIGDFFALLSAIGFALYLLVLKKKVGDARATTISLISSIIGLICLVASWPIQIFLSLTSLEPIVIPDSSLGFLFFLLAAFLGFFINWTLCVGTAFSDPLYVAFACLLALPLTALADWWLHQLSVTFLGLFGTLLIVVGFTLINLDSTHWISAIHQRFNPSPTFQPLQDRLLRDQLDDAD